MAKTPKADPKPTPEVLTEVDTPEMEETALLKWKLDQAMRARDIAEAALRKAQDDAYRARSSDKSTIAILKERNAKLIAAMSVADLRKAGATVYIDFEDEED